MDSSQKRVAPTALHAVIERVARLERQVRALQRRDVPVAHDPAPAERASSLPLTRSPAEERCRDRQRRRRALVRIQPERKTISCSRNYAFTGEPAQDAKTFDRAIKEMSDRSDQLIQQANLRRKRAWLAGWFSRLNPRSRR